METDLHQVLEGCKKGEHLMQKKLYEHCYTDMMKTCLRYTKDNEKASTVYNDAMLKVFRNINSYSEQGKLIGWIKKVVINTAVDYIRVKSNFLPETLQKEVIANEYEIEGSVFEKMDAKEIRQLINSLPEKLAVVFNLFIYEGYEHHEIGTLLNIPSGTSRYYLSEARKQLKERVQNPFFSLNKAISQ